MDSTQGPFIQQGLLVHVSRECFFFAQRQAILCFNMPESLVVPAMSLVQACKMASRSPSGRQKHGQAYSLVFWINIHRSMIWSLNLMWHHYNQGNLHIGNNSVINDIIEEEIKQMANDTCLVVCHKVHTMVLLPHHQELPREPRKQPRHEGLTPDLYLHLF